MAMPHHVLHHSSTLEGFHIAEALLALNTALVDTDGFHAIDIKSRAQPCEGVCIGLGSLEDASARPMAMNPVSNHGECP
jgi:5-carboxymethyl-2-hydroxymuconate isomerase